MKIDFVELLKNFGIKFFAGLSGWKAWLLNLVFNKLSKAFVKAWNKALKTLETKKEIKDELKKYDERINKPNATEEEIRDAGRDFIK